MRTGATTPGVTVTTPSLKERPDAWRYRWHENRWWYYGTNNHWLYWTGHHWNAFPIRLGSQQGRQLSRSADDDHLPRVR